MSTLTRSDPEVTALLVRCLDDRLEREADVAVIDVLEAERAALLAELSDALTVAVDQPQ